MKPKLVIFDVDGLMLDTEALWQKTWTEVGLKYGAKDWGQTIFLNTIGRNGKESHTIIYQELGKFGNPEAIFKEIISCGLKRLNGHIDPKPGIYELLERLKTRSIKTAVATATPRAQTIERLTRLKLIQYFDFLLCGDEIENRKPHPEIYLNVLNHFNVDANKALVLEDSYVGVEAAYRAHIPCIMIPDLMIPTEKQKQETIAIVSSLFDVLKIIEED